MTYSRFLFVSGDKDFYTSRWKNEDSLEGERKDKGTTYIKTQLQVGFASHLTSTINNPSTYFPQILQIEEFTGKKQEIYFINSDNYIRAPEKLILLFIP